MHLKHIIALALAAGLPTQSFALGIRLFDHDAFATARGDAFVATADNPSAIYYNPAGISQLSGQNLRGGVNFLSLDLGYEDHSGRNYSTRDAVVPVPGFFYTYALTNFPITFGLGYYVPYGLSLEWPDNTPFRTTVTRGELQYNTLNPVFSWQALPSLSIAAGPTINYAKTDLRRGIATAGDEFKFTGDDFVFGVSAGLLWKPALQHSFGVSYRSPTTLNLEGKSRILPYPVPVQQASVELPMPQVIIAGYSFRPTPHWNLEVDIDWTDWSNLNDVVLKQSTGNITLPFNWKSSWAYEAGATRYFDNGLHVSGGYVFLQNSVPTQSFNPLVPDQDLHVFSTGVGGGGKIFSWDLSYQFSYGPGREVAGSVYGSTVSGNYTFIAHALAISLGCKF